MFKFLKDKLKGAISKFSRKTEDESAEAEYIKDEEPKEEAKKTEKKLVKEKQKKEKTKKTEEKQKTQEEKTPEEEKQKTQEEKPEKKGLFSRITEKITKTKLSEENFEKLFWELELALLESNVAVEVIEKIKEDLKKNVVDSAIQRGKVEETITKVLRESVGDVLSVGKRDVISEIREKKEKPYIICFIGVNGSGKTTSIAKFARMLEKNKISCVLAAADTFRAAAIDQLKTHGEKLGIKVISHDYGSDPAAVAFDAVNHAKAKTKDAVLIDTAGRMHSNSNLMDEMKKIIKVAKPDLKIFVGESIVGNDCIEQAKSFDNSVGIDAILLSKADIDEKGGAAVSVSFVTGKPVIFIGTGQKYDDLKEFDPEIVIESLGL